jgi:hypothetical protein
MNLLLIIALYSTAVATNRRNNPVSQGRNEMCNYMMKLGWLCFNTAQIVTKPNVEFDKACPSYHHNSNYWTETPTLGVEILAFRQLLKRSPP